MRITQILENSTTAGSVATVAQPMMTQTRESVNVRGLKPVQQVMQGKAKKQGTYANSISESKVTEDDLSEQDLIVIPGQGRLKRTGFVKHDLDQGEHEGHTLKNSLHTIARAASELDKRLSVQSEFPEWVSEKIGAAKGMMVTVMDYLISSQEMQHDTDAMNEGSQRVDSLVTDALRVMKGPEVSDAVLALKRVLGDRAYNERRGFYSFYVDQIHRNWQLPMYGQQGVAEGELEEDLSRRGFLRGLGAATLGATALGAASKAQASQDLGNGFVLTTVDVFGGKFKAVLDTQSDIHYLPNRHEGGGAIVRSMAPFIMIKNGQTNTAMNVGPAVQAALKKAGLLKGVEESVAKGKIDFAKKLQGKVDKHNKAVVQTRQAVGSRIADIGAGGKEHNVKTDAAWDAAKKKVAEGYSKKK